MSMSSTPLYKNTSAWNTFTLVSWAVSAAMMAGGIWFLEASFSAKGFYAMSALMLVHTTIAATKSIRDQEEQSRMINKIEDARTERLLMETGRVGNI